MKKLSVINVKDVEKELLEKKKNNKKKEGRRGEGGYLSSEIFTYLFM